MVANHTAYENSSSIPSDLTAQVSTLELASYCQTAVTALLIYDMIITMHKEIKYFWTVPFSSVNLSFFLIRYSAVIRVALSLPPMTFMVNKSICKLGLWAGSLLDWTIVLCMDYISYLRVRAIYSLESKSRQLVTCLQMLFALEGAITLGSLIISTARVKFEFAYTVTPVLGFCSLEDSVVPRIWLRVLYWTATLVYELILMALAIYKAAGYRKTLGFRGLSLLKMIIYDQVIYFAFVIFCSVANIVTTAMQDDTSAFLNFFYVIGGAELLSLLGSRMLIHLKEAVERKPEVGESFKITSDVSAAEFRTYSRIEDPYLAHCAGSSISEGMDSAPELPLSIQAVEL